MSETERNNLTELLKHAKPATNEELKAQGESLARSYKPGPRQARPMFKEEQSEAQLVDPAMKLLADLMHLWVDGYISKNPTSSAPDSISADLFGKVEKFLYSHGITVDYCGWKVEAKREKEPDHICDATYYKACRICAQRKAEVSKPSASEMPKPLVSASEFYANGYEKVCHTITDWMEFAEVYARTFSATLKGVK